MESKPTLISALVKAQSQMSHAAFDQTNPHFKSKFASLKSVIDAVKPALNANGIAFLQEAVQIDGVTHIETVFYGYNDMLRTGPVPVVADKQNAQGFGSGMTYAKRYSLSMALGIAADEDDDGNAAAGDGCSAQCTKEDGYTCVTPNCTLSSCATVCGDGERGEQRIQHHKSALAGERHRHLDQTNPRCDLRLF